MKLVWKGFMNEQNLFVYPSLPPDAKKLSSDSGNWVMYLLVIPVLLIAYAGIKLRLSYTTGVMFTRWAPLAGVALALPFLIVHELIHAVCCPRSITILAYITTAGLCLIPDSPLKKRDYIMMAVMPAIVLGICPFLIWLLIPELSVSISSILFGFSLGNLSVCIGDIYNTILAVIKMTPKSVLITSGKDCYYFE